MQSAESRSTRAAHLAERPSTSWSTSSRPRLSVRRGKVLRHDDDRAVPLRPRAAPGRVRRRRAASCRRPRGAHPRPARRRRLRRLRARHGELAAAGRGDQRARAAGGGRPAGRLRGRRLLGRLRCRDLRGHPPRGLGAAAPVRREPARVVRRGRGVPAGHGLPDPPDVRRPVPRRARGARSGDRRRRGRRRHLREPSSTPGRRTCSPTPRCPTSTTPRPPSLLWSRVLPFVAAHG
nr:hypothetical protein [Angustibacter aerolatus]